MVSQVGKRCLSVATFPGLGCPRCRSGGMCCPRISKETKIDHGSNCLQKLVQVLIGLRINVIACLREHTSDSPPPVVQICTEGRIICIAVFSAGQGPCWSETAWSGTAEDLVAWGGLQAMQASPDGPLAL